MVCLHTLMIYINIMNYINILLLETGSWCNVWLDGSGSCGKWFSGIIL